MITLSHKIELVPNKKQKSYFRKAFGCARLAYNWGLAEWQRRYKEGDKVEAYGLKKAFNAIKKEEFPFVIEVTKYATQQPFINLGKAFKKFFEDLKKGIVSYPQFKRKKDNEGSFYRLTKAFNAIKIEEFPFVVEDTNYATQHPFMNHGKAFKKFFEDLKKGIVSYPQFKRKKYN